MIGNIQFLAFSITFTFTGFPQFRTFRRVIALFTITFAFSTPFTLPLAFTLITATARTTTAATRVRLGFQLF
ncbi:hypothetical protein CK621_03245 [Vandammella animalimorsus]|uniref:Uncharacterized protein n=1 Tax=Vandammella animalimorsus TaxID=2029117 RepID=A0A2A2B0H0_9BURK|nr:hypothetical protein CK621_03245 [Vandammella animalimorsus]